jgi:hypothetical protein
MNLNVSSKRSRAAYRSDRESSFGINDRIARLGRHLTVCIGSFGIIANHNSKIGCPPPNGVLKVSLLIRRIARGGAQAKIPFFSRRRFEWIAHVATATLSQHRQEAQFRSGSLRWGNGGTAPRL